MTSEKDPNGIDSKTPGAKLDAGKPSVWRGLLDYFPRACIAVASVSTKGASKYSWKGWESVPEGFERYSDALSRHLLAESIEGPYDSGPKGLGPDVLHAAQVAWNALARLELKLKELDGNNIVPAASTYKFHPDLYSGDSPIQTIVRGYCDSECKLGVGRY